MVVAPAGGNHVLQSLHHQLPIGQLGEHIEKSQFFDGLFCLFAGRDVVANAPVTQKSAIDAVKRRTGNRYPQGTTAFGNAVDFQIAKGLLVLQGFFVCLPVRFAHVERGNLPAPHTQLGLRRMHGGCEVAREIGETEFGVLLPIPIAGEFGQGPKTGFTFHCDGVRDVECFVVGVTLGDVQVRTGQANWRAGGIAFYHLAPAFNPDPTARFMTHAEFNAKLPLC